MKSKVANVILFCSGNCGRKEECSPDGVGYICNECLDKDPALQREFRESELVQELKRIRREKGEEGAQKLNASIKKIAPPLACALAGAMVGLAVWKGRKQIMKGIERLKKSRFAKKMEAAYERKVAHEARENISFVNEIMDVAKDEVIEMIEIVSGHAKQALTKGTRRINAALARQAKQAKKMA